MCCFQGGEEESPRPLNGTHRGGREAWFPHVTAATGGTVVRAVTRDPESSVLTLLSPPVLSACTGERCPETECQEHFPAGPHMSQTISGLELVVVTLVAVVGPGA